MPVPLILPAIAGVTALYGIYKTTIGAIDQTKASDMNADAMTTAAMAARHVDQYRQAANAVLEDYGSRKLRAYNGIIADFIDTFGQLKNVDIIHTAELDRLNVGDFSTETLQGLVNDYALLKSSGLGIGAGLGSGAALAFGAYNGTMMLATASTGTAISTLSGAAATNATLAWLGGGAISAGGGGMALGTMVLGGILMGPALAVFGHIVGNRGEAALNKAQINVDQARTIKAEGQLLSKKLDAIARISDLANTTFSKVSSKLRHALSDLRNVIDSHGTNYGSYPDEIKAVVLRSVKFVQLLKAMIDTPILDKDGNLVLSTEKKTRDVLAAV